MSKINELIVKYCADGVDWKQLGEFCEIKTGKGITKIQGNINGLYPIISGGKQPMGYFDTYNRDANNVTISRVGANAGFVSFIKDKFYLNDKCFSVIPKDALNKKYLYHYLKNYESNIIDLQSEGGVPTINTQKVAGISIPIPQLPVQEEIVKILDKFTELEAVLEAELEARTRQYEYYRNQLLSFEGKEVEWKTLEEVCLKTSNVRWKERTGESFNYIDLSAVNRDNNQIDKLELIGSDNAPSRAQQIVQTNDIIFGTTRPTLKRYAVIRPDLDGQICSTGFCVLRPNLNLILPKFLFFILKSQSFFNYVENNQEGAGYPSISNSKVKNFQYQIPSIEEQERIVKILDNFDALVNDISNGLPAEIKARREQYEYYRGKLLTFKPLVHS